MGTNQNIWTEQRNFCVKSLQKLDYLKGAQTEPLILTEVKCVCEWIRTKLPEGTGIIRLKDILIRSTANTIWDIITKENLKTDISHLLEQCLEARQLMTTSGNDMIPLLEYFMPKTWITYWKYKRASNNLYRFVEKYFQERKKLKDKDKRYDMISAYLDQIKRTKDIKSSFHGDLGMKNALESVIAMIIHGTEFTSPTLQWLIFYLCVNPKVQKKVKKEINETIGPNQSPTLEDRIRMPYTEAVILETLRMSPIASIGQVHKLSEDIKLEGYNLPKGLPLLANIYHLNHDKNIWEDSHKFRPERFLDEKDDNLFTEIHEVNVQKTKRKNLKDFVFTFQSGRRSCIGETIARDIMFLSVVTLLNVFTFKPGRNKEEYLEPEAFFLNIPQDIPLKVTRY